VQKRQKTTDESTAITPEVMPKPGAEVAKCLHKETFQTIAVQINTAFDQWKWVDRANTILTLRMGIMLEYVKSQMEHGEWEPWREAHVQMSRPHTYRFRGVAQRFLAKNKLNFKAVLPMLEAQREAPEAERFEQLAMSFVGDLTQTELFEKCKCIPERRGGDHGGGAARAAQMRQSRMELERLHAQEQWQTVIKTIREFAAANRHIHIEPRTLTTGIRAIKDALKIIGGSE